MAQNIYILSDPRTPGLAEMLDSEVFSNGIYYSPDLNLTEDVLISMARACGVEYFYVIKAERELCFTDFNFSFKPESWDKHYMHTWNNDVTVRLFCAKEVLSNPLSYTDASAAIGEVAIKNIDKTIYTYKELDIIFLSYDEAASNNTYNNLRKRFNRIKRVHGVKGIKEAHRAAAKLSSTDMFYVVDADADISPDFDFSFCPIYYERELVHVWYSKNPVNDLEYGWGGVKLFPKNTVVSYTGSPIDFTTSVASGVKVIPIVANTTKFNTDPFSTWRSAFRECVKLSTGVIAGEIAAESTERLDAWCTVGNGEFGEYSVAGALAGRKFGEENINQPAQLQLINDFNWLSNQFRS